MPFTLGPRAASAGYRLAAFDRIGSTNAEALRRAREGERGPTWFVTSEQTAGRGRRQRVYMVGFDFSADAGYARMPGEHFEPGDQQARRLIIGIQENILLNALYMLRGADLDVVHVGNRNYSRMTPEELAAEFMPSEARSKVHSWRTKVTAEITTNHFGDRARLERMVRSARAAGSEAEWTGR